MPIINQETRTSSVPQFGIDANAVRVTKVPLDKARSGEVFYFTGTFLYAISASSKSASCDIAFQEQIQDTIPYKEGQFISGLRFSKIYITNTAQAGAYLFFMYGVEQGLGLTIQNPASQFTDISILKGATITTPMSYQTVSGVGAAEVLVAAQATRRRLIIMADPANTTSLRVGGSDVTDVNGIPLGPGQSMEVTSTAGVYVWSTINGMMYHFFAEYD